MTLNSKLIVSAVANLSEDLDLGPRSATLAKIYKSVLDSGVAVKQADLVFHDTRTLAASATEDLDLAGGLTNPFGVTLTFVKVKGLIVSAAAGNTNNVIVGAAAVNAWAGLLGATGTLTVRPGTTVGVACGEADASGYAVTAGTGDLLKVANGGAGTPVTYDLIIIGTSA